VLRTTLAGVRAHLLRLMLTAVAIALGVGFVSGTFVLTDTMEAGFDQQFTASADKVSVAVLPRGERAELPAALLARLRNLPGVSDAQGQIRGDAPLIDRNGRAYGSAPTVGLAIVPGPLQRYPLKRGRLPVAADEVVLDTTVARRTRIGVGDTAEIVDRQDRTRRFRVTGLMDFGVDQEIGVRGAVGFIPATATAITGRRDFVEIDVKAASGMTDARLRDAVAAATGGSADVLTSGQLADRLARTSGVDTAQIALFFLAFALVSLFVAALVIYNTFNILIAQRLREMALLRCLGATRSQIFRGVLGESLLVGLGASVLGVFASFGLGAGGAAFFGSAGGFSTGPLVVTATPIIVGVVVGTAVTMLSALLPARSATRVAPVTALRHQADGQAGGRAGLARVAAGAVFGLGGLGLGAVALAAKAGQVPFVMVLAGGSLLFFALVALSPLIVGPLSGLAGWLPARLMGVPGRLARENARRNPKRAAITTVALTVGVTLMTMVSVALASARATTDAKLTEQFPVDYRLSAQADRLIPFGIASGLRARPEFSEVIEVREAAGRLDGQNAEIDSISAGVLGHSIRPKITAGSLDDLRPGTVVLQDGRARALGVGVGRVLELRTATGVLPLTIAAIFTGGTPMPPVTITEADFQRAFGVRQDKAIYLVAHPGVPADASRQAVQNVTARYPMIKVGSVADLKAQITKALDQIFVLVASLLALAIIISLIGIANTLTLSVMERTRESALLRALGLTRRGLRRMLSIEAVIMAVIGALVGVVLGTVCGWAALVAGIDGAVLSFPAVKVIVFVLVAALAGTLAAVLPGRRAARAPIVSSLAEE
jgi:putative ABC transport system permease protein